MKSRNLSILIIFVVLLIDQLSKIWIKLNMNIGESIHIFDWFQIYFIENEGMAFGMTIGSKFFLTLFRIILSGFLIYYLVWLVNKKIKPGYIAVVALLIAGAIGNIIDCVFYGQLFGESTFFEPAEFLPAEGGYAPFFYGKVVDMLYFPIIQGTFWSWIPFVGGDEFLFFSPIFNIADSAISVGVAILFLFYRHDFSVTVDEVLSFSKQKKDENKA